MNLNFCIIIIIFTVTGSIWALFEVTWEFWWSGNDFDEFFLIIIFLFLMIFYHYLSLFLDFLLSKYIYIFTFLTDYIINSYYNSIQKYYKNKNKFTSLIKRIVDYGFVCLDKDNRYQNDEEIIKLNI